MARCEDWPACGHESGCCPDYDDSGRQLNMVCTCGAKLPINNRYSICNACLRLEDEDCDDFGHRDHFDDDFEEDDSDLGVEDDIDRDFDDDDVVDGDFPYRYDEPDYGDSHDWDNIDY